MSKLIILMPLLLGAGLEPTHYWFAMDKTEKEYKRENSYCKGKVRGAKTPDVWDKEHIDFLVYKACMKEKGYEWRSINDRSNSDTADNGNL